MNRRNLFKGLFAAAAAPAVTEAANLAAWDNMMCPKATAGIPQLFAGFNRVGTMTGTNAAVQIMDYTARHPVTFEPLGVWMREGQAGDGEVDVILTDVGGAF